MPYGAKVIVSRKFAVVNVGSWLTHGPILIHNAEEIQNVLKISGATAQAGEDILAAC